MVRGNQTLMREDMSPNGAIPEVLILRTQAVSLFPAIKATVPTQLASPFSRRVPLNSGRGYSVLRQNSLAESLTIWACRNSLSVTQALTCIYFYHQRVRLRGLKTN